MTVSKKIFLMTIALLTAILIGIMLLPPLPLLSQVGETSVLVAAITNKKQPITVNEMFNTKNSEVKICTIDNEFKQLFVKQADSKYGPVGQTQFVFFKILRETYDVRIKEDLSQDEKKKYNQSSTLAQVYELMKRANHDNASVWEGGQTVNFYVTDRNGNVSTVMITSSLCGYIIRATNNQFRKQASKIASLSIRKRGEIVAVISPEY
jgi:hypothetical protein